MSDNQTAGVYNIGLGSIGIGLPPGQSGPVVNPFDPTLEPVTPQVTSGYAGAALTNSIFASLDYPQPGSGFSARMNAEPLTLQTQAHGLDITYENQINVWHDPNDPKSMGYNYSQNYFADMTAGVAGLNATQTKLAAATDWTATADWSNGQMQATMGEGLPFVYVTTQPGETATIDLHAQPLDPTQGPVNPLTYTLSGLNGTFNGGQLKFNLPVDAGSNIAEGVQVLVSYDFDGDGKVDATQTYNWFGTDNTAGAEAYTDAEGLASSTGTMADMKNGTVAVQVWKRMGNGDLSLVTNSANSSVTVPFDNLTTSGGQAASGGTLYLQGGAQAGGASSTLATAPTGTPGEDTTHVNPQTGVGGYTGPGTLWYNQDGVAGVTINGRNYGLFGPTGSTWVNTPDGLENSLDGKTYYSVAVLPDNSVSTLMAFRAHAYAFVTNTAATYDVDQAADNVSTTYTVTTTPMETGPGLSNDPLIGLFPAQQSALDPSDSLSSTSYVTAQGPMTLLSGGSSFTTTQQLQPLLPILPFVGSSSQEDTLVGMLHDQLGTYLSDPDPLGGDSYWGSRQIAKYADLALLAQQVGYGDAKQTFLTGVEQQLDKWFTAGPNDTDGYGLYYDQQWQTLIGYPADFYSDTLLNDHMFHYGYLINAAATVAMLDPTWAGQSQYGGVVNQLIQDADDWQRSSTDPNAPAYPYLRDFDPYAGHSWAGGTGNNNNEESVSEALNFASSVARWGAVTGQTDIENLGLYLQTTESNALEQYWFDVDHDVFPDGYKPPYVAQIYSDGAQLGTYFGTTAAWELGINITPMNGGSLFYAEDPQSIRDNLQYLAQLSGSAEPTDWKLGFWMYQALVDPQAALAAYQSDPNWRAGAGEESKVYTLSWLDSLTAMGTLDKDVTADSPYAAVFQLNGVKSYVAFNPSGSNGTITFTDGKVINLAPDTMVTVDGTGATSTINYLDNSMPYRPTGVAWDLPGDPPEYGLTPVQTNGALTLSVEQNTNYLWVSVDGVLGTDGKPVEYAVVKNGVRVSEMLDAKTKITAIGTDSSGQMWLLGTDLDGVTHYVYQLNAVTTGTTTQMGVGTNGGAVYGSTSYATLEPLFNQDFNGDGIIQAGPATSIKQNGQWTLLEDSVDKHVYVQKSGQKMMQLLDGPGGAPLSLTRAGDSFVSVGETEDGTLTLLDEAGDGTLSGWSFDAKGQLTGVTTYTPSTLAGAEALFQLDLNGDGVIAPPLDQFVAGNTTGTGKLALLSDPATGNAIIQDESGAKYTISRADWGGTVKLSHNSQFLGVARGADGNLMVLDGIQSQAGPNAMYWGWILQQDPDKPNQLDYKGQVVYSGATLDQAEALFKTDLDGDGLIDGVAPAAPGSGAGLTPVAQGGGDALSVDASGNAYVSLGGAAAVQLTDGAGNGVALKRNGSSFSAITTTAQGQTLLLDTSPGSATATVWAVDPTGELTGSQSYDAATVFQAELLFGKDIDGDGVVGDGMKLVAQANGTSLYENTATGAAFVQVGAADPLKLTGSDGTAVTAGQNGFGFSDVATNAQGQTLVLGTAPGSSGAEVWTFNATGKLTGAQSYDAATVFQAELLFNKDIDGDGTVGDNMKVIARSKGDTLYENTATGVAYVQAGTADPVMVSRDGSTGAPIKNGDYSLSAVTTDSQGNIRVLDTSPDSPMSYAWYLNANGQWSGEQSFDQASTFEAETLFNKDLNGNGSVGDGMKLIAQDQDDSLYENTGTGVAYVQVPGSDPVMITRDGAGWGDVQLQRGDYALSAVSIDSQGRTRVLDQSPNSSTLYAWTLDSTGHWTGEDTFDASNPTSLALAESLFDDRISVQKPTTEPASHLQLVEQNGGDSLYVDPTSGVALVGANGQSPTMITRDGTGWGDVQLQHNGYGLGAIATDAQGQTRVLDESASSPLLYAWILDGNGHWSGEQSFDASTVGQAEALFGVNLTANGQGGWTQAPASATAGVLPGHRAGA